jgi:hypothetical protein
LGGPIPEENSNRNRQSAELEDLQRKNSRLQAAIDRQQNGFDKRLKWNDEEWQEKVHRIVSDYGTRLKSVDTSWHDKYELLKENLTAVLNKNAQLEEQWPALEARAKDGEGYREKLIMVQDDLDQIQSLQNQELAEVKHLVSFTSPNCIMCRFR